MRKTVSYKVAGHVFSLTADAGDIVWEHLSNYAPFIVEPGACGEIFNLEIVEPFEVEGKKPLYVSAPEPGEQRIDIFTLGEGYLFELAPLVDVPPCGRIKVSDDFSHGCLMSLKNKEFNVNNALMLLYAFRTASMGTLEMHASVTVKDGKGYLFLGRSGTGKSTHSRMWLEHIEGTRLLNDDNPVVRVIDGRIHVYGTPWSGKTPCYKNETCPVGAIVRIQQAPGNAIRRMSLPEAFASVSSSSSGLRAIRRIGDGLFATLSTVVQHVPCYLLECLPDGEAAELCCKTVTDHGEENH